MEQREKLERNTNEVIGSGQEVVGDSTGNEPLNAGAATPKKVGRSQISPGRVVARLQSASKAFRNTARNARTAVEAPLPTSAEEVSDETVQADALMTDVTK